MNIYTKLALGHFGDVCLLHHDDDLRDAARTDHSEVLQYRDFVVQNHVLKHFTDVDKAVKLETSMFQMPLTDILDLFMLHEENVIMKPHKIDSDYFWLILDIGKTALLPSQVARPGLEFSHCKIKYICIKFKIRRNQKVVVALFPNESLTKL